MSIFPLIYMSVNTKAFLEKRETTLNVWIFVVIFFYLNWFLEITLCNATFQGYINMIKTETSVSQIKPQKIIFIFIRIVFILQNGTRFVQNLLVWSFKQKATCIFTFLLAVYFKNWSYNLWSVFIVNFIFYASIFLYM